MQRSVTDRSAMLRMKLKALTYSKGKPIVIMGLMMSVIVLIINMKENYLMSTQWYKRVSVCFSQSTCDIEKSILSSTSQIKPEFQRCSFNYLSAGNVEKGRKLLDSITWPETVPLPEPFSLKLTTNASQSLFTIVPQKGGWCVGDELTVRILLKDHNGNTKRNGGDFLIAKLHNQQLNAGVVGTVQDHLNGTFSAVFPLLWKGAADVQVTLVQTSESITVLKRLNEEEPDRVQFTSVFRSGSLKQTTSCNVCLDPEKAPLCDFSDPNTGEQWICYKPSTLDCDTRVIHSKNVIPHSTISKEEEALFQKRINMKVPLKAVGNKSILILPKKGNKFKKMSVGPSGYYYNEQWRSLSGPAIRPFNNISVTACLRGKRMYFFGDSTIRQYYLYITALLNLQTFDKNNPPQSGPFMAIDYRRDILVSFRAHGLPIRFVDVQPAQLRYVANELDGLIGGPNTVIVIGVWSHFSHYPLEVYYQRLMTIHKSVQRLLKRAPGTKVVIRSANMKDLTLTESQANSDWYSLQQNKVLRAVFKDTGVFLLDAWQMVQAHHLPHNLHPPPQIIKIMIDAIMSYTCPQM